MYPVETINYWLALAVIALQIVCIAFLALLFLQKKFPDLASPAAFLKTWGLWIGFLLSLGGVAISLFYSEILGVLPCGLCWLQRVFLYPQVLLFAVAIWKRDRSVADYSIAFSLFGGVIALYQHYLQMGGTSIAPCPAVATGVDCAQRYLFEFGYVTFPLMSFTIFALLAIVMLFVRKAQNSA